MSETEQNIVRLQSSDFTIASEQLSAAFMQDPLLGYFLPQEEAAKQASLGNLSRALLNFAQPYSHVYTTADELKGVAVWLPPSASQLSVGQLWQALTSGLLISPLFMDWERIGDFLAFVGKQFEQHEELAPEPHWYLAMLGVSPNCQGQGIGGMLLQPVMEEADRTQVPCYLETTTPSAVRFYERNGFEVIRQASFADRDYWAMKRYPRR